MSPYTESLYTRFISCLEDAGVKPTVTKKGDVTQVDFRTEDEELFAEVSEIVGVDPTPVNRFSSVWRVFFT